MAIPAEKIETNYFSRTIPTCDAAYRFASILHKESISTHCNAIRFIIDSSNCNSAEALNESSSEENKKKTSSYASNDIAELVNWNSDRKIAEMESPSIYLTINDFRGYQRLSPNCHKLNGLFIDIDCHDCSSSERDFILDRLQDTLNKLWNNGTLLRPSMVTHSGRGFGLFYVLQRSIACVQTTAKLQEYYKFVYLMLIKAYSALLNEIGVTVDTCVTDRARVARMPGTFNHKAYRNCELYDIEPLYYTLREIYDGCHLQNYVLPREEYQAQKYGTRRTSFVPSNTAAAKPTKSHVKYNSVQLNHNRISFLDAYIDYRETSKGITGYRDVCLFLYYNALVQVMEREDAKKKIMAINETFSAPLANDLIRRTIFASVDTVNNYYGLTGFYPFSNDRIIELLGISYEEANALGLRGTENARTRAKANTKQLKEQIKEFVRSVITKHPNYKRHEWLHMVNALITNAGLK